MPVTFDWSISNLDFNLPNKDVYCIHWMVTAKLDNPSDQEDPFVLRSYGTVNVNADITSDSFISYDSLTVDIINKWLKERIDTEKIETSLTTRLNELLTPTSSSGVPW